MQQTEPGFTFIDPATHRKSVCSSSKSSPSFGISPMNMNVSGIDKAGPTPTNPTTPIKFGSGRANTTTPATTPIKYNPTSPLPMTPAIDAGITTVSPSNGNITTPESLLSKLLSSETQQNNWLIEILSFTKPNIKHIAGIVRGLFTKNTKLLALLNSSLKQMISNDEFNDKEIFKGFINEFILWLENDGIKLLEKFNNIITNINNIDNDITGEKFNTFINPILNCYNYIDFLDNCIYYLRNPFIIDKISNLKSNLENIIAIFQQELNLKHLNNIKFNRIKSFDGKHSVSSCFKLNQIVERTEMEVFFINNNISQIIELCLLDLSDPSEQRSNDHRGYNALAILAIEEDYRSLLFPPFRINEFSCNFSNSSIVLTPIDYTFKHLGGDLIVHCPHANLGLLKVWYDKLTHIFPYSLKNNPINSNFNSNNQPEMNGLGIVVSNVSSNPTPSPQSRLRSRSSANPFDSPSRPMYRHHASHPEIRQSSNNQMTPPPTLRRKSNTSIVSNYSSNSQNKSMNSTNSGNGTISKTSQCSVANITELVPEVNVIETPGRSYSPCLDQERHHSSQAEISYSDIEVSPESIISSYSDDVDCDPIEQLFGTTEKIDTGNHIKPADLRTSVKNPSSTLQKPPHHTTQSATQLIKPPAISQNYSRADQQKFQSVPDLAPPPTLYKLSTGSSIDISNFGSSHQPTFSVMDLAALANGSTTSIDSVSSKKSKRKIFGLFRKSSMKSNSSATSQGAPQTPTNVKNNKSLKINTTLPASGSEMNTSLSSSISDSSKHKTSSQLPSPFALPSSTSTYFFKQESQNSSVSTIDQNKIDNSLAIPQELKHQINEAEDVYISSTSPKAMQISKWKQKYGKWEMLTVNENLFIKIVINYETSKGWLIAFEEVAEVDEPILILDLNECTVRQSTSLDVQLTGVNSITLEKSIVIFRCKNGLSDEVASNIKQAIRSITKPDKSLKSSSSNGTIMSPMNSVRPSKSSTLSSISTYSDSLSQSKYPNSQSSSQVIDSYNQNNKERLLLMKEMTVRLQRLNDTYEQINNPVAWKVLSMYSLSIYLTRKNQQNFFNLILRNMQSNSEQDFIWMIEENDKHNVFERIGKAGLLLKADNGEHFMIECKGKREFTALQQIL